MTTDEILARLVAFPSVVGRPNREIVEWIADHARACGAAVTVLPGPEGDRSNLFVTVGPREVPGIVLSGHMDVVAADEAGWTSDPFVLRRDRDRLYGRGTSDMKGFLACALAALPELARLPLARPLHLAFSYDEEAGCRGVPHLLAALDGLCARPEGCIVGEPSGMRPVHAHKGKAAARLALHGRTGHSSRPDLGLNAIHAMTALLTAAVSLSAELREDGPRDPRFEPPWSTLQVGTIAGGTAVNVIPEDCRIDLEVRAIAGVDPVATLAPLKAALSALVTEGFGADWTDLSAYPALALDASAPLAGLIGELAGTKPVAAVSYGTEAGLYQAAGIDAVVCGPGDIARAHRADEYVRDDELSACRQMVEALGRRLCA